MGIYHEVSHLRYNRVQCLLPTINPCLENPTLNTPIRSTSLPPGRTRRVSHLARVLATIRESSAEGVRTDSPGVVTVRVTAGGLVPYGHRHLTENHALVARFVQVTPAWRWKGEGGVVSEGYGPARWKVRS